MKLSLDKRKDGVQRTANVEAFFLRVGKTIEDNSQDPAFWTFLGHGWYWTANRASGQRYRGEHCHGPFASEALALADAATRASESRERADRAAVRELVASDGKGGR